MLVVLVLSNKLLMQLFPHTILKALSQFFCGAVRTIAKVLLVKTMKNTLAESQCLY